MTGPEAASDASRRSSGVPDTDGVPAEACGGQAPDSRASRGDGADGRKPRPDFIAGEHFSEHRFRPAGI